ncbi:MAG: hypothetical protein ABH950_05630 [Candidatus Altiarchaeota archaeon]
MKQKRVRPGKGIEVVSEVPSTEEALGLLKEVGILKIPLLHRRIRRERKFIKKVHDMLPANDESLKALSERGGEGWNDMKRKLAESRPLVSGKDSNWTVETLKHFASHGFQAAALRDLLWHCRGLNELDFAADISQNIKKGMILVSDGPDGQARELSVDEGPAQTIMFLTSENHHGQKIATRRRRRVIGIGVGLPLTLVALMFLHFDPGTRKDFERTPEVQGPQPKVDTVYVPRHDTVFVPKVDTVYAPKKSGEKKERKPYLDKRKVA